MEAQANRSADLQLLYKLAEYPVENPERDLFTKADIPFLLRATMQSNFLPARRAVLRLPSTDRTFPHDHFAR
jgi:hypothetical protein